VFADSELLASLNAIVHPAVARDFEAWARRFTDRPYVVLESAILIESGFDRLVDRVVTVSASEGVRVERVLAREVSGDVGAVLRDAVSDDAEAEDALEARRKEVVRRMANQMNDAEREARAWRTIDNSGGLAELAGQAQRLDKELK
jgi:dephospho-CoA kinase